MDSYKNNILLGDSLQVLKSLPSEIVDCSITSPPYNKQEKQKGWLVKNVIYENSVDSFPEDIYQEHQIAVLNEAYRVTKQGGSFFYNHKVRWDKGDLLHPMDWLRKTKWCIKQEIIWDRMIAANIRGWRYWQVEERIYWLYKPMGTHKIGNELESRHAKLTSIWRGSPERNNPHPAPFPLWFPVRVIASMFGMKEPLNRGLVLDPYSGSGTSLVAAKLLGHDFIGIDASQEYIEHAKSRLENYKAENERCQKELALHVVNKTFSNRKDNGENTGKHRGFFEQKPAKQYQLLEN